MPGRNQIKEFSMCDQTNSMREVVDNTNVFFVSSFTFLGQVV